MYLEGTMIQFDSLIILFFDVSHLVLVVHYNIVLVLGMVKIQNFSYR